MKNLIYQVWAGELRPGCKHSEKLFREYAKRVGADYRLDIDPNIAGNVCDVPMYFEWLNPMLDDSFLEYDKVLVVDMDIFPTVGADNIFEEDVKDVGICTEPFQGEYRASTTIGGHINKANDERWAEKCKLLWGVDLPRDDDNYLKVYNAGMVLFTKDGLLKCKDKFLSFQKYINTARAMNIGRFYTVDQNYFHVEMIKHLDYTELSNDWNCYIHYTRGPLGEKEPIHDSRGDHANFVHIQLSGADYFDNDLLDKITNENQIVWRSLLK
jgi:hypothetical protein